jgi:threonine dehydrogenase-like Zn-dependent dehydrogenase
MKAAVVRARWEPRATYQVSEWERATGKALNGSSVWRYPQLALEDLPEPSPAADEVVIAVRACGICGSDVHFLETDSEGYMLYPGLTKFPVVIGHEFSGEVVAKGEAVQELKLGQMVVAEEMNWCGYCAPCRNGFPNHCQNLEELGFTVPGAMAERVAVKAKYCWPIDAIAAHVGDAQKAFELGALVEPTAVSYNAIFSRAGGIRPGERVAVFGCGPIGLAAIALARTAGASRVEAFEISPVRRELALRVGADAAHDPKAVDPAAILLESSAGEGFDLFVEAAGAPERTIPAMERALAINARVVQIGRAAQRVPIYLETFQVRRAQVFGSQGHSGHGNFPNVIRLLAAGRLDLSPIITARFPLAEVASAMQRASARQDGKVMVLPYQSGQAC